ncbi:MAG TPA: XrtA/PEP-CTERM system TPR-repeat protein PrsT [Burkholderiales bacterium]
MKISRPSVRIAAIALMTAALLAGCSDKPETLVNSAKDYLAGKDTNAAVIQLRNALQQKPDYAEARYLLGITVFGQRDYLTAEKELRHALELGYAEDEVLPPLARAMVENGKGRELTADFGTRQLKAPAARASFQTALGDAWLGQGKIDDAERAYGDALQAQADYAPAKVGQARVLASRGDMDGARRQVDATLKTQPDNVEALILNAELLVSERKNAEAEKAYAKAVDLQPYNHAARRGQIAVLIADKDYQRAATQIEASKKAGGGDARLEYLQALLALREERYGAAMEHVQLVLKGSPDHVPSLLIAGAAQLHMGEYVRAEESLRKVLDYLPRHQGARRMLVNTQLRMGQAERAQQTLEPLLLEAKASPQVLALAGEVHLANNDMTAATDYFERAAKLDGKDANIRARLGQVHFASGEQERGIEDLEDASAADATNYRADLLLVLNHIRNKEFDKAAQALKTLEKKQPNNPVTHNVKGVLYIAQKQPEAGRASLEKALSIDPYYYPALMNLARLDIRDKKPTVARKRFEDALAKKPNNEQLLLGYANVLSSTGAGADEVARTVERAARENPTSATAHVALINYYRRSNNRDAALSAAQKALASLPDNTAVLDAAGQAQLAAGETQQAISTFQKLINAAPNSPNGHLRLAQAYGVEKNVDGAIQSLRKAVAIRPDLDSAKTQIVGLLLATHRTDEALAEARKLQKQDPKDALGYTLEGDVYAAQSKWPDAERHYREAMERAPDNTEVFIKLHSVLEQADQSAGKTLASKWVQAHPKDIAARNYLAERELREKDYSAAIGHYKAILNAEPRNALVLNNIAWASAQQKDPHAIEYAQKAYDIAPTNPAIMDTLGTLLVDKGEVERGLPLLEQAVKLAPEAPAIRINYAKALIKAGKGQAARTELQSLMNHQNAQVKSEAETLLKTL